MVENWLKSLGIEEMCEWDVAVFLHYHRTALLAADGIAQFLRYGTAPVVAALDQLEVLGMLERSRLSQGARLYVFTKLHGPRANAFKELLLLNETRSGRLQIADTLRESCRRAAIVLEVHAVKDRGNSHGGKPTHSQSPKEDAKWSRAI